MRQFSYLLLISLMIIACTDKKSVDKSSAKKIVSTTTIAELIDILDIDSNSLKIFFHSKGYKHVSTSSNVYLFEPNEKNDRVIIVHFDRNKAQSLTYKMQFESSATGDPNYWTRNDYLNALKFLENIGYKLDTFNETGKGPLSVKKNNPDIMSANFRRITMSEDQMKPTKLVMVHIFFSNMKSIEINLQSHYYR